MISLDGGLEFTVAALRVKIVSSDAIIGMLDSVMSVGPMMSHNSLSL